MVKTRQNIGRIALCALALMLALSCAALAESVRAKNAKIKIYASASTKAKVVGTVNKGTVLAQVSAKETWVKVKYDGKTAYVRKTDVTLVKAETASASSSAAATTTKYVCSGGATLYASASAKSKAVKSLSPGVTVTVYGAKNGWCKVKADGKAGFIAQSALVTKKPSASVIDADWWTSNIRSVFSRGTTATVTDVSTGVSFRVKRTSGTNHADCEPLTASDTAKMKKIYGSWSWDRRAIWVKVGGKLYAASMNGMPHGDAQIGGNDFDGHFCIHFTNSRTHASDKVDSGHQSAIRKAIKAAA